MRVAYLVNQYPKVSHTFIRREIAALERLGAQVLRFAVRGWDAEVVDPDDQAERGRTHYLLQGGLGHLLRATVAQAVATPSRFLAALALALRMSRRADRPWPFHLIYLAEACALVRALAAQGGAEQLHAHFGTNAAEVAMLAHALGGPPFSFTVHGPEEFDKPQFLGLAEKIHRANAVVAISAYGRSQLWRWAALSDWAKVHIVHCGLEPQFFGDAVVPPSSAPRLVCVGRLCEQKGQLLLVDAAAQLAAEGLPFELVLAGDGEMRPDVEAAIRRHHLADRVRITGWISSAQVRDELAAARAMVLPSFAEGLPVVIMEAMAVGRPVLTTYVAGIPELVRDGVDGWLFEAGSPEAAARAMRACLAATPEVLDAMGRAGRERVLARHHVDTEAARLLAVWRSAAGAAR
ncbi:glycosyltransferase family 4 protein [Ideonella sp. DXS29W]|uniref:Glycosyltransferase family 4 protein n=1 Tax=Ideonella lacteola TaxID=2984193 RepID=A0ABU9BP33_9BURK